MNAYPNITKTILYSLIFAIGGAPTLAMLMIKAQTSDPNVIYQALISLSVVIACILVPIILIQNTFLLFKRSVAIESRISVLLYFYLILDVLCLLYWLSIQFFKF
jgi:hypothetical protein